MAENKKVQIKNTGGDALYPRTAAENIVNIPGGTMNVFMYLNGYGNENQFPDPYKGDRYFDSAAHKVYECVTATTWTGKKEVTSWGRPPVSYPVRQCRPIGDQRRTPERR